MFLMKWIAAVLLVLTSESLSAGIEPGVPVASVPCEAEPQKSYALYLPSAYDPEREWPLILAFDPSGNGLRPVEIFEAAAERHGYIVAGSNDSRNYTSWEFELAAAAAVWRDVAGRFSIDSKRVYTAGFFRSLGRLRAGRRGRTKQRLRARGSVLRDRAAGRA